MRLLRPFADITTSLFILWVVILLAMAGCTSLPPLPTTGRVCVAYGAKVVWTFPHGQRTVSAGCVEYAPDPMPPAPR